MLLPIIVNSQLWRAQSHCWAVIVADQFRVLLSTLLNLQYFLNPRFPVSFPLTVSSNDTDNGRSGSVAVHRGCILVSLKKVGSAINCSVVSAHFSISAYFLTVQTYKRMRLTTRVYSIWLSWKYWQELNLVVRLTTATVSKFVGLVRDRHTMSCIRK